VAKNTIGTYRPTMKYHWDNMSQLYKMKLISKKYRIVSATNQLQLRYSCLEYFVQ